MSKDNEKARAKAEKEFVASVRELASYVKKRDPRVIQHLKEIEEKRLLREAEEQARREAEKQKMLEELAKYEESGPKIEYTEDDLIYLHQFDNEDEENQIGKWSCPFCKREIKTESAFKAHCATKKHQKAANGPKRRFLSDPTLYEHKAKTYVLLCMNEDEIRQIAGDVEIDLNNLDDSIDQEDEPQNDDNLENEEEEDDDEINKQKGKKKQLSKKEMRRLKKKEENMAAAAAATNKKAESQQNKKQPLSKKEKRKQQIMEEKQRKLQMQEEEHKAKLEMKQQKNEQRIQKELEEQQQLTKEFIEGKENEQEEPVKPEKKLSKKEIRKMKQKQALEEMNKESNDGQPKRLPKNIKNPPPGMFMCRKCRLLFPSRKKLFDHLNESGHAIAE
ncbi:hypothetical protein TRFO_29599 [Tritrichomonas foetus]|uniref:C2H2-type domain-containing protein n=1 Tax=Tritrichomonas foetus TaxID=1144522 RepID=A0A1J4JX91_9EUKA|nr:hypothetical protein TRFO_29599 [Tritrichomonas foetus]|eukprot:OHT03080.1 hypothetical protein TRFO_29599 [Tritrichomonas foetus]